MRWFKRAPPRHPSGSHARLPSDMLARLEQYGRYEFDKMGSGLGGTDAGTFVVGFVDYIEADDAEQEGFLRDLHALVAGDRGGFATYGAAHLAWDLFGEKALAMPAALALIDAGIEFKLARGLPPNLILTGYELRRYGDWFDQMHGAGEVDPRHYYQWLTQPRDPAG